MISQHARDFMQSLSILKSHIFHELLIRAFKVHLLDFCVLWEAAHPGHGGARASRMGFKGTINRWLTPS